MQISSLFKSLLLGAALTSSVFANSVTFSPTGFNGGDPSGGEFQAVTSNNSTFLTFCLEETVFLHFGANYTYTIDGNMVKSANDPISQGTAWLFLNFSNGTLVDSDGVGNYLDNHNLNAGLLQKAIWALEDEIAAPAPNSNAYYDLALLHGGKTTYWGNQVAVLNPWAGETDVQSVLIRVPDSGTTAILLGLGMVSIALIRRKK